MGPGPRDPRSRDLGTRNAGRPPQSLKVGPQDPLQSLKVVREIFNVTLGVPNFVADGEIHATCLASNLPDNS